MKNKKIIIIAIIILLLAMFLIIFAPRIIRNNVENIENDIYISYVDNIEYDIYISYKEIQPESQYATRYKYRLINLEKKKLYIVENKYVDGLYAREDEKGPHYTVAEKDLTDVQIKKVNLLYNEKLDYEDSNKISNYYIVKLNGKEMKLKSLPFEDDLW